MSEMAPLRIEVEIDARPETVFGFFTRPEDFARWMGAAMGKATIEPEVGGALRVDFGGPVVVGQVTALDSPRRFAFTWGYEGDAAFPAGSSEVGIELEPTTTGTRLVLVHEGLPSETLRDAHEGGFRLYLSLLAAGAADAEHGANVQGLVDAWFAAWNADAPADRAATLERCLAPDGEFRDAWAAIVGRRALSGHIGASRSVMSGIRLEPDGPPTLVHRFVRFGWKAVGEQGTAATGENFGALDGDGRFALVVGFRNPQALP